MDYFELLAFSPQLQNCKPDRDDAGVGYDSCQLAAQLADTRAGDDVNGSAPVVAIGEQAQRVDDDHQRRTLVDRHRRADAEAEDRRRHQ